MRQKKRVQLHLLAVFATTVLSTLVSSTVVSLPSYLPTDVRGKRGGDNCPTVVKIRYYADNLTAVANVRNAEIDPNFTLKPSNELVDEVCPKCLNSSNGQLLVDLGRLMVDLNLTDNITLHMSWELHHSWEEKCGGGYLTWVYDTDANSLQCVERPELVKTVKSLYLINNVSTPISNASSTHFTTNLLLSLLSLLVAIAITHL